MSITIIVSRTFDEYLNETGEEIDEDEWDEFVESQDYLRFREEPYIAPNPTTGESIEISPSAGATEVSSNGEWLPFLEYRRGELHIKYSQDFEDSENPQRKAISDVAGYFAAIIMHDAGDEILKW